MEFLKEAIVTTPPFLWLTLIVMVLSVLFYFYISRQMDEQVKRLDEQLAEIRRRQKALNKKAQQIKEAENRMHRRKRS